MLKQRVVALAVPRVDGQTDRSADLDLDPVDRIAPADIPADLFRDPVGDGVAIQVRKQRHELVAAVTAGEVFRPDASCDAGTDGREQPVGDPVPILVMAPSFMVLR